MAGVLLQEVEQDPFQGGGRLSVPAIARLAYRVEVVPGDDRRAAFRLGVQREEENLEGLLRWHVPAALAKVAPRVGDVAPFEAPLEPSHLDVGQVLEQLEGGPAGRQPAPPQLPGGQAA